MIKISSQMIILQVDIVKEYKYNNRFLAVF